MKVLPDNTSATRPRQPAARAIQLGLKANWGQFALLVLVNAFVGGMVGLERTLLPLLADREFGVASSSAALSFIIAFGLVKALTNFFAGRFSDKLGRKPLLVAGWLVGLPVPVLLIVAPGWEWVIFANILLGINQGLCWSTTVIMKIDLVGPARRGLAMGLNEAAGYGAVAFSTLAAGYLAGAYGLRPYPFLMGLGFAGLGLFISVLFVRETHGHARHEALNHPSSSQPSQPRLQPGEGEEEGAKGEGKKQEHITPANLSALQVFKLTTWQDRRLFAVSQAGLVNNLNDGLVWGLMPLYLARFGLSVETIAGIGATYLASWGVLQLFTGALSDRVGRRPFIMGGMLLQGLAIGLLLAGNASAPGWWYGAAFLLGLGTALVYPTLLATIGDIAHPRWRASAVGVYRLWRDSGYAVGAILAGVIADLVSMEAAIGVIAGLTALSGGIASKFLKPNKQ